MNQRQLAVLALLILLGAGQPQVSSAESGEPVDEITVEGQTLRGTVMSIGSDTVAGGGRGPDDAGERGSRSHPLRHRAASIGLAAILGIFDCSLEKPW
jgi:hypothetical protein